MVESACASASTSTSTLDGKKKEKVVDSKEIMNLCLFYISVVECTYCPHAMDLLFDCGRGGVESEYTYTYCIVCFIVMRLNFLAADFDAEE